MKETTSNLSPNLKPANAAAHDLRRGKKHYWSLLPIPALLVLITILDVTVPPTIFYDPTWLILIGNTVFVGVVSFVVAYIAYRNYLTTGRLQVLWLGCALLLFGLGAVFAAAVRGLPGGANLNVTIYNTGVLLGGMFHFVAALMLLAGLAPQAQAEHRKMWLGVSYSGSLLLMVIVTAASLNGVIPPFFIQGAGPTLLRQQVLGVAALLFLFSCLVFLGTYHRNREPFLYWYAGGLGLTAISLTGFFIQHSVGSPVGWLARISQYLGGIYFLIALLTAARDAETRGASLDEMLATSLTGAEEKFRSAFANAAIGFAMTTPAGRFVDANAAYCATLGYTVEELRALDFAQLMHPDDRAANMRKTEQMLSGEIADFTIENRYLRKGGQPVWVRKSVSLARDTRGSPRWVVALVEDITGRKQVEEALRQSLERLQKVLEVETVGVMFWDLSTGCMVDANDTFLKLTGYSRSEVESGELTWQKLTPPDYMDASRAEIEKFSTTGRIGPYEKEYLRKDGSRQWLLFAGSSLGKNQCVEFCVDISDRKRAEEGLRESETQFRTLANAIPQLCWMANADGWIFWYNERWYEYTGTTPEQMEGWGWKSVHDPEILPAVLQRWQESITNGLPFEMVFPLRGVDGVFHPFLTRILPVRDAEGKIVRWFGTNTDITTQKQTEEALRASEQRLQQAADLVGLVPYTLDPLTGRLYWDAKVNDLLGLPPDAAVTYETFLARVHPEDRAGVEERTRRSLDPAGDGSYEAEFRVSGGHDGQRWVAARGQTTFAAGEPTIHRGVALDITERKRTLELLIRSEKVAALGRMAAGLAHDINNPLSAVMNALFLARSSATCAECADSVRTYLQLADQELKRVSNITQQALGFYREGSTPTQISIRTILDETVDTFRSKIKSKNARVETKYEGEIVGVLGISGELRQMFSNLLANSLDAVGQDGIIKLRVTTSQDKRVRITIADNGTGIAPGDMSRIFEPLFTTKGSVGTGLGLWVTKQLIDKYGGSIRVRSSSYGQHRGTTFFIVLPAAAAALEQAVSA